MIMLESSPSMAAEEVLRSSTMSDHHFDLCLDLDVENQQDFTREYRE